MNAKVPLRFDGALRPEWIDFALTVLPTCETERHFRSAARQHLAPQIGGAEALTKSVTLLNQLFGFRSPISRAELHVVAGQLAALQPGNRAVLRLSVLLRASHFVQEVAGILVRFGAASEAPLPFGDVLIRAERKFGERGSIRRRIKYVLQTLRQCGGVAKIGAGWRASDDLAAAAGTLPQTA